MRNKLLLLSTCFSLVLILTGCETNSDPPPPNLVNTPLSTTQFSEYTNLYFEEVPGFQSAFVGRDWIPVSVTTPVTEFTEWVDSNEYSPYYYQLIWSDPESWSKYIYYRPADGFFGYYSFRFSIVDSVVKFYVTPDEESPTFIEDYILILIQATSRGLRPTGTELYIDGVQVERN